MVRDAASFLEWNLKLQIAHSVSCTNQCQFFLREGKIGLVTNSAVRRIPLCMFHRSLQGFAQCSLKMIFFFLFLSSHQTLLYHSVTLYSAFPCAVTWSLCWVGWGESAFGWIQVNLTTIGCRTEHPGSYADLRSSTSPASLYTWVRLTWFVLNSLFHSRLTEE